MEFRLEDSLGFHINRAFSTLRRAFNQAIKPYGIAAEQWAIMKFLEENGPMMLSDVAHGIYKEKSTITRMVEGLAKKGFVARRSQEYDRRAVLVFLTQEGKETLAKIAPISRMINEELGRHIDPAERALFLKILDTIYTYSLAKIHPEEKP